MSIGDSLLTNRLRALEPVSLKVRRQPIIDRVRIFHPNPVLLIVARISIIATHVHQLPVYTDNLRVLIHATVVIENTLEVQVSSYCCVDVLVRETTLRGRQSFHDPSDSVSDCVD